MGELLPCSSITRPLCQGAGRLSLETLGWVTPQCRQQRALGPERGARQEKHRTGGCEIRRPGVLSHPARGRLSCGPAPLPPALQRPHRPGIRHPARSPCGIGTAAPRGCRGGLQPRLLEMLCTALAKSCVLPAWVTPRPHSGLQVPKWGGHQLKARRGHHFHQFPSPSASRHPVQPPCLVPPCHTGASSSEPPLAAPMAAQPGTGCGTGPAQPSPAQLPAAPRTHRDTGTAPRPRSAPAAQGSARCWHGVLRRAVPSRASGATAQSRLCPGRRSASASSHHLQPPGAALQPPGPPRQQAPDTAAVPAATALSPQCPHTGVLGVRASLALKGSPPCCHRGTTQHSSYRCSSPAAARPRR